MMHFCNFTTGMLIWRIIVLLITLLVLNRCWVIRYQSNYVEILFNMIIIMIRCSFSIWTGKYCCVPSICTCSHLFHYSEIQQGCGRAEDGKLYVLLLQILSFFLVISHELKISYCFLLEWSHFSWPSRWARAGAVSYSICRGTFLTSISELYFIYEFLGVRSQDTNTSVESLVSSSFDLRADMVIIMHFGC